MQIGSCSLNRGGTALMQVSCGLFIVIFLSMSGLVNAHNKTESDNGTVSLGKDQTIIDLSKVDWKPLTGEGIPPGPEIAVLRGSLAEGGGEMLVRLPANYTFPNHSHTSDELYIWLKGDFTYVADDGTTIDMGGQSYISLPGGVSHALKCGEDPCVFYSRYSQPFDYHIHPMPVGKK